MTDEGNGDAVQVKIERGARLRGEFKAMNTIVKALEENVGNITPSGRRWLREKLDEILADDAGGGR